MNFYIKNKELLNKTLVDVKPNTNIIYLELLNKYYCEKSVDVDYIIYPHKELMKLFNISKPTVIKYLRELEDKGYIRQKRRGLTMSNLIYITDISDNNTSNIKEKIQEENQGSDIIKDEFKLSSVKTKNKPTIKYKKILQEKKEKIRLKKQEYVNSIIEKIKSKINYDELKNADEFKDNNALDVYIETIEKSLHKKTVRVNKKFIDINQFINKILNLTGSHLLSMHNCIINVKSNIKNFYSYILTSMYNIVDSIYLIDYDKLKDIKKSSVFSKKIKNKYCDDELTGQELEDFILAKNDLYKF